MLSMRSLIRCCLQKAAADALCTMLKQKLSEVQHASATQNIHNQLQVTLKPTTHYDLICDIAADSALDV